MSSMSRISRHGDLVTQMADTLGVDLAEEMQRGEMPPEELRSLVMNCTGCTNPEGCAEWLSRHTDGVDHTPVYCRNKERLESMAKGS